MTAFMRIQNFFALNRGLSRKSQTFHFKTHPAITEISVHRNLEMNSFERYYPKQVVLVMSCVQPALVAVP